MYASLVPRNLVEKQFGSLDISFSAEILRVNWTN